MANIIILTGNTATIMSNQCLICIPTITFPTMAAKKSHIRASHQHTVTLKFKCGGNLDIQRDAGGSFMCICGELLQSAEYVRKHATRHEKTCKWGTLDGPKERMHP
jgi:hypothetical protein